MSCVKGEEDSIAIVMALQVLFFFSFFNSLLTRFL